MQESRLGQARIASERRRDGITIEDETWRQIQECLPAADTTAAVDEIHAEKTAIRNRPRVRHRETLHAGTTAGWDETVPVSNSAGTALEPALAIHRAASDNRVSRGCHYRVDGYPEK